MNTLDDVRSQDAAVSILRRALRDDTLASAYLFEGPSGVGKERAARALATELIARGDAQIASRIENGHHPDLRVFRPRDEGNRNLKVETIRDEVLPFAQFAPFEAQAAIVIFPEADVSFPAFHPEAANALLKTLEEPKSKLTFILLAERPDRLLPTIRSRCQRVPFAPLPDDVVEDILAAHEVPDEERSAAVALARGRADRALDLAKDARASGLVDYAFSLHETSHKGGPGALIEAAEALAKLEAPDRVMALETLALLYRDLAVVVTDAPHSLLAMRFARERVEEAAAGLDVATLAKREARVHTTLEAIERNANAQSALDAMMFDLRKR